MGQYIAIGQFAATSTERMIANSIHEYAVFCTGWGGWDKIAQMGLEAIVVEMHAHKITTKSKAKAHFTAMSKSIAAARPLVVKAPNQPRKPKVELATQIGRKKDRFVRDIVDQLVDEEYGIPMGERLSGKDLRKAAAINMQRLTTGLGIGGSLDLGVVVGGCVL